MPKFVEIGADEASPAELDEAGLEKALKAAQKDVDRLRKVRVGVREETPKSKVLEALVETEEEFQAAIDRLNQAEHDLGRFRGAGEGQHVAVGLATEVGSAGSEG